MRLVETDTEGPAPTPPPATPRPEHRRVAVSFLLTAFVLVATVITVYALFPERHNALLTRAFEVHREQQVDASICATDPPCTQSVLAAWSAGVLGNGAPWPEEGAFEIVGLRRIEVLNRPVAVVRYRIGEDPVTIMVQRAHDTPPRRYRRRDRDLMATLWRRGRWTLIAVGPAETIGTWGRIFRVP